MIMALAGELGKLPNKVSLEGYTHARPYPGGSDYSNWELSVERANAARRLMQPNGVNAGQVVQVRGYADQRLRKPDKPEDASNRWLSLIVHYLVKNKEDGQDSSDTNRKRGHPLERRRLTHRRTSLTRLHHLEVIGYRKNTGHAIGTNASSVLVGFVVHHSFESHTAGLHHDTNRLLHTQRIPLQAGKTVDRPVETSTQLVIHGSRRQ